MEIREKMLGVVEDKPEKTLQARNEAARASLVKERFHHFLAAMLESSNIKMHKTNAAKRSAFERDDIEEIR